MWKQRARRQQETSALGKHVDAQEIDEGAQFRRQVAAAGPQDAQGAVVLAVRSMASFTLSPARARRARSPPGSPRKLAMRHRSLPVRW